MEKRRKKKRLFHFCIFLKILGLNGFHSHFWLIEPLKNEKEIANDFEATSGK
jgi:hypothetical protein